MRMTSYNWLVEMATLARNQSQQGFNGSQTQRVSSGVAILPTEVVQEHCTGPISTFLGWTYRAAHP